MHAKSKSLSLLLTHRPQTLLWVTPMAIPKRAVFNRRSVDHVTDEIVIALSGGTAIEFKPLFLKVFNGLKNRNAASGGEEMLRLRCYEKLLKLAKSGLIEKMDKTYRGLEGLDQVSSASQAARSDAALAAAAIP
jgi:hypothetical protein